MSRQSSHILVIRISAMGDVAMTVPVLRVLTNQYPQLRVSVLTKALYKPFFIGLRNVEVIDAKINSEHKGFFGLLTLAQELKHYEFDAIADLHNVIRSNVLRFFFYGKPFKQIDKGRNEKKALTQGKFFQPLKTTVQRYADVFSKLGFPVDLSNPNFPERAQLSEELVDRIGGDALKWIGIAPFAAHKSKMYPLEKMKEVIATLSKDYKIVLFGGGKEEISALNLIQAEFQNTINLAGKLSMENELDVISNLDVMVSMDSGNGHLSAMLGVPTITIWGVTHPFAGFAPYNQPEAHSLLADRMQYPEIPTSVYGNKYPEGYQNAAGSISPESVVALVMSVIE